jgi:potassium efflux system protein
MLAAYAGIQVSPGHPVARSRPPINRRPTPFPLMTENSFDRRTPVRLLAALLLLFPLLLPCALAQAPGEAAHSVSAPIKEWQKTLDEAEKDLAQPDIRDSRLAHLRDQLADLQARAREAADGAARQATVLRDDLDALGPPPAEGAPPEAPNVVARRKSLNEELAAADGTVKEAELVIVHAKRVMEELNALRRTRFTERVLARSVSPLAPSIWRKALPDFASAWNALSADIASQMSKGEHLAIGLVLALVLAFPLRSRLIRRFGYIAVTGEPTYMQRLWAALFTGIVRSVLPSLAAGAIYLGLLYDEALSEPMIDVARTALAALIGVFFVAGFCHSALAPYNPDWRLVRIHDHGARVASRAVTALAVLFALDRVLGELGVQYEGTVEMIAVRKFVFGLLISGVLLALLQRRVWFADETTALGSGWQRLRYFLAVLVAAIPLTAVLGYVVLSRLLATQLVLTAGLWASVALLRRIVGQSAEHVLSADSSLGRRLRSGLALSDEGADMLAFWLGGALQFIVLAIGVLVLLVLWGYAEKDLIAALYSAFFGFRIGEIEISLAQVLLAMLLFALLLAATRMLQKSLDQRIFPRTRLDLGMRHSIRSAVGYVGFTLAAMLAVSTVGINLSNLAIIAGALSVGIGFGLQNIVNNFVSGLILLVERPIKAGDWVVVGDFQGYVKKISVRATEIATFDRASVFIPNSSLISGSVMNRTYADKVGRVLLPIGIAYEADPRRAREILLEIALAHLEVRRNPPPNVAFLGFGDNALNLELAAFLHDVDKVKLVTSDLCFAIHEAFKREGIHIPFPQRDLRVTLDEGQVRRIFEGLGEGRRPSPAQSESFRGSAAR